MIKEIELRVQRLEKEVEDLRFFVNELYNLKRDEQEILKLRRKC